MQASAYIDKLLVEHGLGVEVRRLVPDQWQIVLQSTYTRAGEKEANLNRILGGGATRITTPPARATKGLVRADLVAAARRGGLEAARGARETERDCGARGAARGLGVGVEDRTVEVAKEQAMAGLPEEWTRRGWSAAFLGIGCLRWGLGWPLLASLSLARGFKGMFNLSSQSLAVSICLILAHFIAKLYHSHIYDPSII
jgi:hypothetical protein